VTACTITHITAETVRYGGGIEPGLCTILEMSFREDTPSRHLGGESRTEHSDDIGGGASPVTNVLVPLKLPLPRMY